MVVGHDQAIDLMLVALLAEGHVLLEGVPGTAKTLLAQCFAGALSLPFKRIQFTPDLMPGDVLGTNVFHFERNQFVLNRGPGLHEHPAGRRDQPHAAQDAVRAAARPCRSGRSPSTG